MKVNTYKNNMHTQHRPLHSAARRLRGQVTLEYFIIFAMITAIVMAGLATFRDEIKSSLQGFMNGAAAAIDH